MPPRAPCLLLLSSLAAVPAAAQAQPYNFAPYASAGVPETVFYDLDRTQVIGDAYVNGVSPECFILTQAGQTFLKDPRGYATECYGTNTNGDIVGVYQTGGAFVYAAGVFTPITPPGSTFTVAFAINDRGQIGGYFADAAGTVHGFVRDDAGTHTIDIAGATASYVLGLNDTGSLVLESLDSNEQIHSYLYTAGVLRELLVPGARSTWAYQINNHGQVALSWVKTDNSKSGGAVYDANRRVYAIVNGPEKQQANLYGIDDRGQVAGYFYSFRTHLFAGVVGTPARQSAP